MSVTKIKKTSAFLIIFCHKMHFQSFICIRERILYNFSDSQWTATKDIIKRSQLERRYAGTVKKRRLNDAILEEAARRVVEEDYQRQNEKALKFPHTFRPEYQMKMNRLFASADAFVVHNESNAAYEDKSFLEQLNRRWTGRSSLWSYRRYIAVAALLMVGMSAAALASDDIRNGLRRLSLQFFSDNVTIEAAPESTTGQEGDDTANGEFHAYKWKEVPEGYRVMYEELDKNFEMYQVDYENNTGNFIHYVQNTTDGWEVRISYDSQKGYKRIIELDDGLEAYSISDGRNNTIFYEKDGYLFEFMSDQPEEVILDYIDMSGILEQY